MVNNPSISTGNEGVNSLVEMEKQNSAGEIVVQTIKERLSNSIKPSIEETERFILYLNNRFSLGLQDNLIINIQDTSPSTKGFFMPSEHIKHYENTKQPLNYICISSLYLKEKPYETIAHELAHFFNHLNGHTAKNNYHHKEFKKTSEMLLLKCEKGKHGYNNTSETPEFISMLTDFQPNKDAFHILQNANDKKKKGSRNLLFMCSCGVKVRTAKNEDKPFSATCDYCGSKFVQKGEAQDD